MLATILLAAIGTIGEARPIVERRDCVVIPAQTASITALPRRRAVRHPYWEPARIDVAIGWTAGVTTRFSEEIARSFAHDAIDHTNEVLRRTGIYNVTVELVWLGPLAFNDVPNETPEHALAWMRADPAVASLQAQGADEVWMVTFWTEPSAAPMPVTEADFVPANGLAVMNIIGGVHSATHEFGHTLGLAHDFSPIEKPPANDPFPWRYAFYDNAAKFKDIMVPRYKCEACEVWDAFSNAASWSTFRGFPTGNEKSDAARMIPLAALHVAAYAKSD